MLQRIRLAEELCQVLRAQISEATVSIRGTYASVALADRSCRVFSHSRTMRIVVVEWRGRTVVEGELCKDATIIACIRAWVVDRWRLDALAARFPHFDGGREQNLRLARFIESRLSQTPAVHIEIELANCPASIVWIIADQRSCTVGGRDECWCVLWTPQRRIARVIVAEEALPSVVSAWTQTYASLDDLRPACTRVEEGDPDEPVHRAPSPQELVPALARAAWVKAVGKIRDNLMLAPLRPLIQPILDRPAIRQFFPFFSLFRLCLSSSSGFRWVTDGLPIIAPVSRPGSFRRIGYDRREWSREDPRYIVAIGSESSEAGVEETVARIEAAAATAPHRPFNGEESDLLIAQLNVELIRQRRQHRAARNGSGDVVLWHRRRSSEISSSRSATFTDEKGDRLRASFDELSGLIGTACRWLEDSPSLDELHRWIPGSSLEKQWRQTIVMRG